jgi:hypothetical protein
MLSVDSRVFYYAFALLAALSAVFLGYGQIDVQSQLETDIDSIPDLIGEGGREYAIGVRLEYPKSWGFEEGENTSDNPMEIYAFIMIQTRQF